MEITEVRVFPVDEEKLKAYVTITLDGCFVVRDLKVINGNTGLFIAMPAKRRKDGSFKDIAHPLNSETRERMEKRRSWPNTRASWRKARLRGHRHRCVKPTRAPASPAAARRRPPGGQPCRRRQRPSV